MPTSVRSHAKINLGLGIGAPRPDGFHSLVTAYQTLEVFDVVTVEARLAAETSIRLHIDDPRVPTDSRNTAYKMVDFALGALGISAVVEVRIKKRLPVQGGMGAGSANAAAALIGVEVELGVGSERVSESASQRVSQSASQQAGGCGMQRWGAERLALAAKVGSDVPLFLIGGTVLGLDRGQEVFPLPDIDALWCVVATPSIGVSTPQAFRDWDALCAREGLTEAASADKLKELSRAYASAFAGGVHTGPTPEGWQAGSSGVPTVGGDLAGPQESALVRTGILRWIQNDFERVVFRQHPSLREIKQILAATGTPEAAGPDSCLLASLSGSGSALFGLYQAREAAESACERLRQAGVGSILTRTLPRQKYWAQMLKA